MSATAKQLDNSNINETGKFILPTIEGIEFVNYVNEEQLDDVMRLVGQDLSEPYSIFTYRYFLHRWPQLCILAIPTDNGDANGVENTTEEGKVKKHRRPIGCVVCKIDIENNDDNGEPSDSVNITTNNEEGGINNAGSDDNNENKEEDEKLKDIQNENKHNITKLPDNEEYTGYIGMLAVEQTHRRSGIGTALVQRAIHRMQLMGCQSIRLETEVTNKAAVKLYEDRLGFIREELLKKYYLNWGDAYRLRLWLDG